MLPSAELTMLFSVALLLSCVLGAAATQKHVKFARPKGIDVAKYQGNVAWDKVAASGVQFAYIKATQNNSTQCIALAHRLPTNIK